MKFKIWSIFFILILHGCNMGSTIVDKNEKIESEKREQIKALNDHLIQSILNQDISHIRTLMSDSLIKKSFNNIEEIVAQLHSNILTPSYAIIGEYHVKNSRVGFSNNIKSEPADDKQYNIDFFALNKEMYISLLEPTHEFNGMLITVIYGKYGDEWKINILRFGQYSVHHKIATDYYEIAKEKQQKGYLVDAINYISIAKQCLYPAAEILSYTKEEQINHFYDSILDVANSKFEFPLVLEQIKTKPKIFKIIPQTIAEGVFPMIYYLTDINIKDTVALKLENNQIKKETYQLFPGLNLDKKIVFFAAYNQLPDGESSIPFYGFADQFDTKETSQNN